MKDNLQTRLNAVVLGGVTLSILMAIIRSFFLFTAYDAKMGYFSGIASPLLTTLYGIITLALAASPLLFSKDTVRILPTAGAVSSSIKALNAFIFFFGGIVFWTRGAQNSIKTELIAGIFLIASTLYFLFSFLSDIPKFSGSLQSKRPWTCFFPILSFILLLANSYFDMTVTINGPFATLRLFSLLAGAVFLLNEIRADIDCPLPRFHLGASLVAFFLIFSSSVSNFLLCIKKSGALGATVSDPMCHLILITFSLFVLLRLLSFGTVKQEN